MSVRTRENISELTFQVQQDRKGGVGEYVKVFRPPELQRSYGRITNGDEL